jgi:hypothetical protein
MGSRDYFSECKAAGREVAHSPPFRTDVKNVWNYTSIPPVGAQLKHRDNFYSYLYLIRIQSRTGTFGVTKNCSEYWYVKYSKEVVVAYFNVFSRYSNRIPVEYSPT